MKLNRKNLKLEDKYPIKAVQFGEGNFLRAFVDYSIHKLNKEADFNAGIAVVQPIEHGMVSKLNEQDGLYTLFIRGLMNGEEVQTVDLIDNLVAGINPYSEFNNYLALAKEENLQFIFSNTTEAGIAFNENDTAEMCPPSSFPAKLTIFLFERFKHFKGDKSKGLTVIPCELIDKNADVLKQYILDYTELWKLGKDFKAWLLESTTFHNTLVDKIVPGYPREEIADYEKQLDYKDNFIVSAEPFFLWVIQGDEELKKKLPFSKIDLDIKIVDDIQIYKTRKVRILNGAHTSIVPLSIMYGNETVTETLNDTFTGKFLKSAVSEEILETLEMDKNELHSYANQVYDRFRNPFIKHLLSSIALNSISKFKVRVLPSLLGYQEKKEKLPKHLVFSLACLIRFYKGDWNGKQLPVNDDEAIVNELKEIWTAKDYTAIANTVLSKEEFWGQDLNLVPELSVELAKVLQAIENKGIEKGFNLNNSGI